MSTSAKRAEVVASDAAAVARFRDCLRSLDYDVQVRNEVRPGDRHDVDIIVYHVSLGALKRERRHTARAPGTGGTVGPPRYWLDAVRTLYERAPTVPILVSVPGGENAAEKALDSGATDVIEESSSSALLRRRVELLELYRQAFDPAPVHGGQRPLAGRPEPRSLDVPLPELRNGDSGRVDAARVAEYLGVSLKRLADAAGLGYAGVHKNPDSERVQDALAPIVRVLELAAIALGGRSSVLRWLNRPVHELEDESPLAVILAGEAGAVATLLENARAGIPV